MQQQTTIRDYRPNDLESAVTLIHRSIRELASRDYSPAQIAAWAPDPPDATSWAERLARGGAFIAERGDHIAGLARIDDTGHVDLLFVHPDAEGRGVARALLEHLCSWARANGIETLISHVSITARPVFERAGFRVLETQEVERRSVRLRNFRMVRHIGE